MSDVKWHGFSDWLSLTKATLSLGTMLLGGLWVLISYAFDDRYAPAGLVAHVAQNAAAATRVEAKVDSIRATILLDQIFELRFKVCTADTSSEARRWLSQRIGELAAHYREVTGAAPTVPGCEEIT